MLNSRIVFAKIGVVLLTLLACYWLQTTSLIALGIFAALHFVYAIVTLALRTRTETAAIMSASSMVGLEADEPVTYPAPERSSRPMTYPDAGRSSRPG